MSVRRVGRTDADPRGRRRRGRADGAAAVPGDRRRLRQLDGRPLVVDLTEVTFFGSAGLRTMAESADHAAIRPGFEPLRVVVDHNRPVLRPMEIVGLDAVLTLFYTVADAIEGPAAG